MKTLAVGLALLAALPAFAQHHHPIGERQAEVAGRGGAVMPFDLGATTHVFTKIRAGGDPRMVAALHLWCDAQLADHGADATAGHRHQH
jgi:hypothetical protein